MQVRSIVEDQEAKPCAGGLVQHVVQHMEHAFREAAISPGARLRSERTVALDLKVSRNTVTAAYDELEQRGLIRRIRGKGTFRCGSQTTGERFSWSGKIASKAHLLDEPVLEVLTRSAAVPFPLAVGTPSLECFPVTEYADAVARVIGMQGRTAFAVAATEGQPLLRKAIADWQQVDPGRVLITSGAQEAIDLLARCLIEPGDYAIVDSPTYPGAIQCLRAAGARLIAWDTRWSLEELELLLLRYRPKLLFTTPTFQNPTGRVMPLATRQGLLDLAARYRLPILEDGVYEETYLGSRPTPPSLCKLDSRSQVIHLNTFSKIIAPGLRVGWIVAPLYMIKQLSLIKMRANLFTGGLNQLVLADFLERGTLDKHLDRLRTCHRILRDTLVPCLQTAVERGAIYFAPPQGGLYLWCKLPRGTDLEHALAAAESKGVSLACGDAFFPEKPPQSFFRLCYTAVTSPQLVEALRILTSVLCASMTSAARADSDLPDRRRSLPYYYKCTETSVGALASPRT